MSDSARPKTSILIPTLNEIDGVRAVLHKIDRKWADEILIIDGNSTDGTIEYCRDNGYRVLIQKDRGYGSALLEAAVAAQGEILVEFIPDGSSLTEKIPELVAKIQEGNDLVLASRYRDGATSEDDDIVTAIGNRIFTWLTNAMFGSRFTDVLIGYRACRKESLMALKMDAKGLSWVSQSSIRFHKRGFKIAEIAADEPRRIGGKRKMHPIKTGLEILKVMFVEYFHD